MTLRHNPAADSILARAPRVICDGKCGRQRMLCLDGRDPTDAELIGTSNGWSVTFIGNPDGSVTRDDRCPDCARRNGP